MKINKFYKLRNDLEIFSFEKNFKSLSNTLYYFSFLGNVFSVLFSYFFIKNVTDSVPPLFGGQAIFFSFFIVLFMIGFELFKRFAFQQLTSSILKIRKITVNIISGIIISLLLIAGSFYLSLNGAHRLIDTSQTVEVKMDNQQNRAADSISNMYQQRIQIKEKEITAISDNAENGILNSAQRKRVKTLETDIKSIEEERDAKISKIENKTENKSQKQKESIKQNDMAFKIMVFFLEFIILIGVAFNAYYEWTSYSDMKSLMNTTKYRELELHLQLLKLYYQNGRKKEQDPVISKNKLQSLSRSAKVSATKSELDTFTNMCLELDIVTGPPRKRTYNVSYEKAKQIFETND